MRFSGLQAVASCGSCCEVLGRLVKGGDRMLGSRGEARFSGKQQNVAGLQLCPGKEPLGFDAVVTLSLAAPGGIIQKCNWKMELEILLYK